MQGGVPIAVFLNGAVTPFCCVKTVSERQTLRVPRLLSSEEQIPQIIVNVRTWRKPVETLESMILLARHGDAFDFVPMALASNSAS
jgi:hypothetical protein